MNLVMCDGCGATTRNATDWVTLTFGPAVKLHEEVHACSSPCLETLAEKLRPNVAEADGLTIEFYEGRAGIDPVDRVGRHKWNRDRVRRHRNGVSDV